MTLATKTSTPSSQPAAPRPSSPPPVTLSPEPEPLKTLLAWQAPSRPFRRRHREVYMTALSIAILVSIILLFIKEFLLIGVIFSVYFLFWVLNNVTPDLVEYKITNQGITAGGVNYPYNQLTRFWFSQKWNQPMVYFEHVGGFPPRLVLMLKDKAAKKQVEKIVSQYLPLQEAPPTMAEKLGNWLSQKVPLEQENSPISK